MYQAKWMHMEKRLHPPTTGGSCKAFYQYNSTMFRAELSPIVGEAYDVQF